MKTHIKVVGWLYIIFSIMGLLSAAIIVLAVAGGGWISGNELALRITVLVAAILGSVIVLFSLPGLIVGAGLLAMKAWARILAIVLGLLNLLIVPVGTVFGVYTLYVMLDKETEALLGD